MDLPDISKIKDRHFLLFLLDILFLILPGIAAFFLFHRNDIFFATDWVKLSLLSASIMIPIVFFNTMLIHSFEEGQSPETNDSFFLRLSTATVLSGFSFYVFLVIGYLANATLKNIFGWVIIAEFIAGFIVMKKVEKRKKQARKQS